MFYNTPFCTPLLDVERLWGFPGGMYSRVLGSLCWLGERSGSRHSRVSNCISLNITWRIEDVLRREGVRFYTVKGERNIRIGACAKGHIGATCSGHKHSITAPLLHTSNTLLTFTYEISNWKFNFKSSKICIILFF